MRYHNQLKHHVLQYPNVLPRQCIAHPVVMMAATSVISTVVAMIVTTMVLAIMMRIEMEMVMVAMIVVVAKMATFRCMTTCCTHIWLNTDRFFTTFQEAPPLCFTSRSYNM